jgi:hypothetical protein
LAFLNKRLTLIFSAAVVSVGLAIVVGYGAGGPPIEERPLYFTQDPATGIITYEAWYRGSKLHCEDGPALVERDRQSGVVINEEWYRDGKLDREDGPAVTLMHPLTGIVTREAWYSDGKRHRDDGPAVIERHPVTGIVTWEEWYRGGRLHRDDGPALTRRDPLTGRIIYTDWWRNGGRDTPPQQSPEPAAESLQIVPAPTNFENELAIVHDPAASDPADEAWHRDIMQHLNDGPTIRGRDHMGGIIWEWRYAGDRLVLHRDGGPARIEHDPDTGAIVREEWWSGGEHHRDDGPAVVGYDPSTHKAVYEEWWSNGRPHRADGPAFVERNPHTGVITCEEWWLHGQLWPEGRRGSTNINVPLCAGLGFDK